MRRTVWMAALCVGLLGGCDGGEGSSGSSTGGTTTDDDDLATTIPVTSVSATMPPLTSSTDDGTTDESTTTSDAEGSTSSGPTETSGGTDTGGTTDATGSTGDEATTDSATTTGNETVWAVEWCNLQFPASIEGTTATETAVFSQLYIEGLTDQSPGNDVDAAVSVEFGYGDDGSDPAADGWTWFVGTPNPGWDGSAVGAPNNDEYTHNLVFAATGVFDYAARVSGDGGTTWSYCDLDGLVEGGYTADQAGSATIQ